MSYPRLPAPLAPCFMMPSSCFIFHNLFCFSCSACRTAISCFDYLCVFFQLRKYFAFFSDGAKRSELTARLDIQQLLNFLSLRCLFSWIKIPQLCQTINICVPVNRTERFLVMFTSWIRVAPTFWVGNFRFICAVQINSHKNAAHRWCANPGQCERLQNSFEHYLLCCIDFCKHQTLHTSPQRRISIPFCVQAMEAMCMATKCIQMFVETLSRVKIMMGIRNVIKTLQGISKLTHVTWI